MRFQFHGGRRSENACSVDGGEIAAEADREPAVGLLELVEVDGLLQLPVGVGVSWGTREATTALGGQGYRCELLQGVGAVDLDEREVGALAGVAAAGAAVAQQDADVHVGAGGEPGDRPCGEVGAGGGREGLAHAAVWSRGADLDQPAGWVGAGEDPQVAVEVGRRGRSSVGPEFDDPLAAGDRLAPRAAVIARGRRRRARPTSERACCSVCGGLS